MGHEAESYKDNFSICYLLSTNRLHLASISIPNQFNLASPSLQVTQGGQKIPSQQEIV